MRTKQIVFTAPCTVELTPVTVPSPGPGQVRVKMDYTAISRGTERANLVGDVNISIAPLTDLTPHFPRTVGYSGAGVVYDVGEGVTAFRPGDRVAVFGSKHAGYLTLDAANLVPIPFGDVDTAAAAFSYISTFPLAAVRKVKPELGESGIVMGLGVLGCMAVQLLKAAGVYPVIAADPVAARRDFALDMGADFVLDPGAADFAETVKGLTDGGANVAIEVSGVGQALDQVLDCMARFGRVALLGCTRDADFQIDYYRKVHGPGITLIGAHTMARPTLQSYPGMWTHRDDIQALLKLQHAGRIHMDKLLCEIHSPEDAAAVYDRVVHEKEFPVGVLFDWRGWEEER